ncbi:hypothetical protein E1176_00365 [Fulvivirga sp. RKSG066]|nr:hypothetical protein [Fulvivirga aurantia]
MKKHYGESFSFKKVTYLPHQSAWCMAEMGSFIISGLEAKVEDVDTSKSIDEIKSVYHSTFEPRLELGEEVILSTCLTGGHIIYLQEVKDDGLVVQDPYGLNIGEKGKYLINSYNIEESSKIQNRLKSLTDAKIDERLMYNKNVKNIVKEKKKKPQGQLPENCGEMNFYNWEEVKKFEIGKWTLTLNNKNDE